MKILWFANTDWYLYNFRLPLARALRDRGHEVVMLCPAGRFTNAIRDAGFRWIPIDMDRRSLRPTSGALTVLRLIRIYRAEAPQLVHHFTVKCVVFGSLAAQAARVPAVVNAIAGLGTSFAEPSAGYRALRVALLGMFAVALRGSQVVFQNPHDEAQLRGLHLISKRRSHLIRGSGVDVSRFRPEEQQRHDGPVRVLLASRLLWSKGLAEYAEAARSLRADTDTVFMLAGEPDAGNPDSVTMEDVEAWRARGDIDVRGFVADMRTLLAQTDVVALPTKYGEGVPRILLEAAACGLPLVASDTPGCVEIVRPGVNGFLVPAGDAAALAEAIRTLACDAKMRARFGAASRRIACASFSEDRVISATLDVYDLAVGK